MLNIREPIVEKEIENSFESNNVNQQVPEPVSAPLSPVESKMIKKAVYNTEGLDYSDEYDEQNADDERDEASGE